MGRQEKMGVWDFIDGDSNRSFKVKMNRTSWMREKVRGRHISRVTFLPVSWIVRWR